MNKVLFTHIDMDGSGSMIMVQKVYPDITVYKVNYGFDEELENLKIMSEADLLIFTDISISPKCATILEKNRQVKNSKILLLDHHQSAYDKLNELNYSWIIIDTSKAGTLLAYEYFSNLYPDKFNHNDKYFAELVSDYDLWEHKDPSSKLLQFLWSRDPEYFDKRFLEDTSLNFNKEEKSLINKSLDEYYATYNAECSSLEECIDCNGVKFGLITQSGKLMSLATDKLLKERLDLVYVAVLTQYNSISFRSLNYSVNKIAEKLDGGGHQLAAGAGLPQGLWNIKESIIQQKWVKLINM